MDREGIGKLAGLLKAFSTLTWVMFMWIGTYVRIHQAFRISMAMNFVTCVLSLNRKKEKSTYNGRAVKRSIESHNSKRSQNMKCYI